MLLLILLFSVLSLLLLFIRELYSAHGASTALLSSSLFLVPAQVLTDVPFSVFSRHHSVGVGIQAGQDLGNVPPAPQPRVEASPQLHSP